MTNAAFRIHLFQFPAGSHSGDNAAIVISVGAASYLGFFDIATMQSFTDGANGTVITGRATDSATGGATICALIECRGAYHPGGLETFTLTLEGTVNR